MVAFGFAQLVRDGIGNGAAQTIQDMPNVPDTQKLKLDLKSWLALIDLQVSGPDSPAIAAGRKLLEQFTVSKD